MGTPNTTDTNDAARAIRPAALQWLVAFAGTPGRAREFGKYTLVSVASLGLDLIVFFAISRWQLMAPALAGAMSCMAGLILHYLLSVHLVFDAKATGKTSRRLVSEYAATGAMGFAITALAIVLTVDFAGLSPTLGKIFGIGLTFISVYLVRAGFVFAPNADRSAKC